MINNNIVIIVAAGKGLRMGANIKKQYLCLQGIPILAHTVMAFDNCEDIDEIIIVLPENNKQYCQKHVINPFKFTKTIHLAQGGKTRQDSVYQGLQLAQTLINPVKENIVIVHDGVRPFVDYNIIKNCINSAVKFGACIPAIKITDTIKQVNSDSFIYKTINRSALYSAQTPQAFKLKFILSAFEYAVRTDFLGTDDASIIENFGHSVYIIQGSKLNIKITTPEDLILGKYLLTLKDSSSLARLKSDKLAIV